MVKKPLDKRKREWSTMTNVNTEEKKKDNKVPRVESEWKLEISEIL